MKPKEVAEQIMNSADEIKKDVVCLKSAIESAVVGMMKKLKSIVGEIPDEDTFLKVLSEIGDMAYKSPNPLIEMFDGPAIYFALKQIDKLILDRFLGKGWYDKLKGLAEG